MSRKISRESLGGQIALNGIPRASIGVNLLPPNIKRHDDNSGIYSISKSSHTSSIGPSNVEINEKK